MFEIIRENFKKGQAERNRELEEERKIINKNYNDDDSDDDDDDDVSLQLPREKQIYLLKKLMKWLNSKKSLKNGFKKSRVDEFSAKENREIQFEPITQGLDEVEKAVKQTDEDLSKKLDLITINKSSPPQLTFAPEEDEKEKSKENIKLIIDKGSGVTSQGLGGIPSKYIPFEEKRIWYMVW